MPLKSITARPRFIVLDVVMIDNGDLVGNGEYVYLVVYNQIPSLQQDLVPLLRIENRSLQVYQCIQPGDRGTPRVLGRFGVEMLSEAPIGGPPGN